MMLQKLLSPLLTLLQALGLFGMTLLITNHTSTHTPQSFTPHTHTHKVTVAPISSPSTRRYRSVPVLLLQAVHLKHFMWKHIQYTHTHTHTEALCSGLYLHSTHTHKFTSCPDPCPPCFYLVLFYLSPFIWLYFFPSSRLSPSGPVCPLLFTHINCLPWTLRLFPHSSISHD